MPLSTAFCGVGDEAGEGIEAQVKAHQQLGWNAIELRTVEGIDLADLTESDFAHVASVIDEYGFSVPVICSRIGTGRSGRDFEDDLAELDVLLGRARDLDTGALRVMSYPDLGTDDAARPILVERFRKLTERAEAHGVGLLHENCVGWAGGAAPGRIVELIDEVASPALRCLFDTGNGLAYGYEAVDLLTQLLPFVDHVHVKDGRLRPNGPYWTVPGDGEAQVAECVGRLVDRGYAGYWSLESHLAVVPHEDFRAPPDDVKASFLAAGRRLETLVEAVTAVDHRARSEP